MPDTGSALTFTLNGKTVVARPGETVWQVARRNGEEIPHLCHRPEPGYRPDGNCRACMVEIEGERVLAASCKREVQPGMVVHTASERAKRARKGVFELLMADQPARATAHDPESAFWQWSDKIGIESSPYPARGRMPEADRSHRAMAVHLDACIHCNLCVRACREVQVNDVIGMSGRGAGARIVFDFAQPMGHSTCVACGECVQACPTGALMPASLVSASGGREVYADRSVDTLCPFCGVGCQTTVHVKEDRIVAVDGRDGAANENRLCVKGRFGYDYIHHPHRLTKPLVRRDDAPKQWDMALADGDWSSVFREATWEEALDRAAKGFVDIRERDGSKALCGFGSAKGSNEEAYLFQKLVRAGFGTNNVDHCTRLCHASSVAALIEGIGSGAVTAPFTAAEDADCIIVIGARPTQNHPVAATYLKQAAKRGADLIILDPREQDLSRHARWHLKFTPGRDVALLNAMIHTIIDEGLADLDYVDRYTEGYEELAEHIKAFSPEVMAPICGIDAATIREVARCFATAHAAMIFWGMGVSQHIHGTDNARCLITLCLISGHVGHFGSGLHPLRGQNNVQGASDAGLIPMFYPDYHSVEDPRYYNQMKGLWGAELSAKRGLTVVEIMDAVSRGEIKGMYVMGENPAMSDPDLNHSRKSLAGLKHLVVQDIFLTETAWHADVVLPASAHAEKTGTFTNTNRQVQMARQVLSPPGDARQDWELIQEMANRIGLQWNYSGPRDIYGEMRQCMPSLSNISWERLSGEEAVTYPCLRDDCLGQEILFGNGFPTPNGRGRMVPVGLIAPDEEPDTEFPMVLTTGRMLEHWHTGAMTRRASVLDGLEPGPVVFVNGLDMERNGIKPGDTVSVATRRGQVTLTARRDPQLSPGMLFIPFCFNEAPANMLTNPKLDPFGKIPEFKFCAARLETGDRE